jgi:hypothetical protein
VCCAEELSTIQLSVKGLDPCGIDITPCGVLIVSCVETNGVYCVNPWNGVTTRLSLTALATSVQRWSSASASAGVSTAGADHKSDSAESKSKSKGESESEVKAVGADAGAGDSVAPLLLQLTVECA